MGARIVSLSGSGEPLLYKDIVPLIDYARSLGMSVIMFTSGALVTEEIARFLWTNQVEVYFKLYSLDPEEFDAMVGIKNAYRWVEHSYESGGEKKDVRIPSGLKYLLELRDRDGRDSGRQSDLIKTETVITRVNHNSIPEVARFCKENGLFLFFEPPVFKGRALENYSELALSPDEYQELHRRLVDILGEGFLENLRSEGCQCEENPVVWTNGEIGFCTSRAANVGNVRNAPLSELYQEARKLKLQEDCLINSKNPPQNRYFRTCTSRRYHELKSDLPCNY